MPKVNNTTRSFIVSIYDTVIFFSLFDSVLIFLWFLENLNNMNRPCVDDDNKTVEGGVIDVKANVSHSLSLL